MAFKPFLLLVFLTWGLLEPVLGKDVQITAMGICLLCQKVGWGHGVWVSSGMAFPVWAGGLGTLSPEQHPMASLALHFQHVSLFAGKSAEGKGVCN